MADYVTKIRTENGDKKIDYNALANLPQADATLTRAGSFADAKAVKDALDDKADKTSVPTKTSDLTNDAGFLTAIPDEYVTETKLSEQGYVTETQLAEQKYVTETALSEQGYVTETQLEEKGYVTTTALTEQGYVTETQLTENLVASAETPGVVKPGEGLTVFEDGTLHVDKHPLEDLSNIHVCDVAPDASTIIDGHWYLVKVEG